MSWEQLELEIGEMFDTYSWRADELERAIESRIAFRRAQIAEYESTPCRKRQVREATKRWREANREHYLKLQRANTKRWRAKNLEKNRKYMREYMREYVKGKRRRTETARSA